LSELREERLAKMHRPGVPAEPVVTAEQLDATVEHALRGLFGRDSLYLLTWALQLLVGAAVTPLVTRMMGTSEFGSIAAATAIMQVLFVVAGLGLRTAIQRHYAGPDGPAAAARLLLLTIVLAGVVTVVADSTGPLWSRYVGFESYSDTLRLAVYWAGVSAMTNAVLALLRSQDRLLAFSCVSILQSMVAAAAGLLLVLVRPTATMFLLGQLSMQVVAAVVGLWLAPPKLLRLRDGRLARDALAYGLPLVPAVLCSFVLAAADRLVVQAELGLTAVARYQVAYNVGDLPMLLLGVLSDVWMPRIFALSAAAERDAVLAASWDALYRLLAPVMIGLSIGAPLVLRLWVPPSYRPDDLLLVTAVVIVSAVPYTAGLSARRVLLAEGRTALIAAATGVAAFANIALNLLLVPRYELVGSAAATFLSYGILYGLLLPRVRALLPTRNSPFRLLQVAAAVVVALVAAVLPTSTTFLVLRGLVVIASILWFGWVLIQVSRAPARAER
jgi:O-antigen/teichoic acid export membrane protein